MGKAPALWTDSKRSLRRAAATLGGEHRTGQIDMMKRVCFGFLKGQDQAVDAETGTGKTLAYMIPALHYLAAHPGAKLLLSYSTMALQEQVVKKDLPLAMAATGVHVSVQKLMGLTNYQCPIRTRGGKSAVIDAIQEPRFRDMVTDWLDNTRTGELDELKGVPVAIRQSLATTNAECKGRSCPKFSVCPAMKARAGAQTAQIIVVNHAVLAADRLLGGGGLVPGGLAAVVIDEAHGAQEMWAHLLTVTLTRTQVELLASTLHHVSQEFGAKSVSSNNETSKRLEQCHTRIKALGKALQDELDLIIQGVTTPAGTRHPAARKNDDFKTVRLDWGTVRRPALHEVLAELTKWSERARKWVPGGLDPTESSEVALNLIEYVITGIEQAANPNVGTIVTVEVEGSQEPKLQIMNTQASRQMGAYLATKGIGSHKPTVVLCSATMPERIDVALGLPGIARHKVKSPFSWADQALIYCPQALPEPNAGTWERKFMGETARMVEAAGGRALILCSSKRMMKATKVHLEPLCRRMGIELWDQDAAPKPALVEQFRKDETSVLVATQGFYQGVDVPGRALTLLVIDRIPMPQPNDAFSLGLRDLETDATSDHHKFLRVNCDLAAVNLAQAAGRGVRSQSDQVLIFVGDRRMHPDKGVGATYQDRLMAYLPDMGFTDSRREATSFLTQALRRRTKAA